ncbi:MAG: transposase [Oscillospiraceae bacterium]|nr:transposase [Oscillospiraceae bacterium]
MDLPKRKTTRLRNYDYSQNGAYFITICARNKQCIFSHIVGEGLAPPENKLTEYGKVAKQEFINLENRYNIRIDKYVIMPNHIHAIIIIENLAGGASPSPTISDIICTFKSMVTRKCHNINPNQIIWQRSFHDHIIRGERDYLKIWDYIDTNPHKWSEDCFYVV